ncbi:ISL3 family transposase, partial [Nonomuraea sp. NPDC048916]|uniref:ISL3 family transposase n=1 Tax=Nonomuraea sp. NPDC048916 TaxID=3154232 RepID=UPI0033DC104C
MGLVGLEVFEVDTDETGRRWVHVLPAGMGGRICPTCRIMADRPKQWTTQTVTHVPLGEQVIELVVHKRRWYCDTPWCARASFTEQVPYVAPGRRISVPARRLAATAIGDQLRPVSEVASSGHMSWTTAHEAFAEVADAVLAAPLRPVTVLGIDETRRGKPKWIRDADGTTVRLADTWHTGFVDISGDQGLLGQVEGRGCEEVIAWLAAQPESWRAQIEVVAIDMSASYAKAVREILPHAQLVVDPFHVVQAATKMVAAVRRRAIFARYGRRGRSGDPEYGMRRTLQRNYEDLHPDRFTAMWNTFIDAGPHGEEVLAAWIAKEELRKVFTATCAAGVRDRLHAFFSWCHTHDHIPELVTLAETVSRWREQIAAAVILKVSNAASEGTNRVIKLVARIAFGLRNPANQRRRSRYATTRTTR